MHRLSYFYYGVRVADEGVGEGADVHESVLVDADVAKGAECGDVGDDALELHARREVFDLFNAVGKTHRGEFRAWIASGLFELGYDVADSWLTDTATYVILRFQGTKRCSAPLRRR